MLLLAQVTIAQPPRDGEPDRKEARDRIEAMAVAYITDELSLTTQEAQKFWPIFNEMRKKRMELDRSKRKLIKEMESNFEAMTDAQAQDYVNRLKVIETGISRAGYENRSEDIIAIIGAKRFLKLIKAEEDFRRKMIKEFRKRRDSGRKR